MIRLLPLVFLTGCFDSDSIRLRWRLDFRHRVVEVDHLAVNIHPSGEDRCATAPECLDVLRERLADARKSAAESGGLDIQGGYVLHDGLLDEWSRYTVPFDAEGWKDASAPLHLVTVDRRGRHTRPGFVLVRDPTTTEHTTWTITGEKLHFVPSGTTPQESWVFTRGHPEIDVTYTTIGDDGHALSTPAWVPTIPGLAEALVGSGLLGEG